LAFNLFGWTLATQASALAARPSVTAAFQFTAAEICHSGSNDQSHPVGDHGGLSCPACFPLGQVAAGLLMPVAQDLATANSPAIARLSWTGNQSPQASFSPLPYKARAPPRLA